MMQCKEKDCALSFSDKSKYYFHLLADHNLVLCPICPSTFLRPRNLQKHLVHNHKVIWNDQRFVDIFIEKFGYEDSLLDFLELNSGFIPLDILRNITRKMVELSGGTDRLDRQISIPLSDFRGEFKVYEVPTIEASEYTKISTVEVFYYQLQYLTGEIEEVSHFWYQFALNQITEFREMKFETFINLIIFGLNFRKTSQLYYNAVDELYKIITKINQVPDISTKVRILNLAITHLMGLGRKEQALNSFKILQSLMKDEEVINKDNLSAQIPIFNSLLEAKNDDSIKLLEEYSQDYCNEFPYFRAKYNVLIAQLHLQNNRVEEARKKLEIAFKVFEQQKDFVQFLKTGTSLVKFDTQLHQFSEAIKHAKYTLNSLRKINVSTLLKLSLRFGILNIDYEMIKDSRPKTLDDIEVAFRKIKIAVEVINEIEDDLISGKMDHYSSDDLTKIEDRIEFFKKTFTDLHLSFTQDENKIITNEIIQLGLSTFSSIDKNFSILNSILRERLYSILTSVENVIGYRFNHPHLLWQSLLDIESKNGIKNGNPSQKLAFLGDTALKLAISEILIEHGEVDSSINDLSKKRQEIEKNANLSLIFDRLELNKYILSNRVIIPSDASFNDISDDKKVKWKGTIVESIIGAIYFDGGINAVKRFLVGWKPQLFINLQEEMKD
ncbi:MAG: ribonuclease III domain-containing protein [Candidatus Hodarchaeota archaeon]